MIEKVNPSHPDKLADRIAGALVDYAYKRQTNPKIAVEVLIGHGKAHIIAETSVDIKPDIADIIVKRIAGEGIETDLVCVKQDPALAENQSRGVRAGDNGIFKGVQNSEQDRSLSILARELYAMFPWDGKYILDYNKLVICQSNAKKSDIELAVNNIIKKHDLFMMEDVDLIINPLGSWSGGINVDTGATNRKLGSDMGSAVTGGGLHGKDISKADVSVNIFAHLAAKTSGTEVNMSCAIGDEEIDGVSYEVITQAALTYIRSMGGFERLAEWGLV